MEDKYDFNLFIGGKTGCFKGGKMNDQGLIFKNLRNVKFLTRESEITAMEWSDEHENDIIMGTRNQLVRVYDSEFKAFSSCFETKIGTGAVVGVTRVNGAVATCSESGHIKVWKYKEAEQWQINVNANVDRMRSPALNSGILATGGKNNDLKLWDLSTQKQLFSAKNVKKNFVELEVPVWVTDMAFVPHHEYQVYATTRHGEIRLYDTKAQRRPVKQIPLQDKVLTTITQNQRNLNQIVVGSGKGHVIMVDVRATKNAFHSFKGAVGSIRQVQCHPTQPYVASVGLDRFLRVHNTDTRRLLHEEYLKVQLNCLLLRNHLGPQEMEPSEEKKLECEESETEVIALDGSDEEYEDMFSTMETVGATQAKRPKMQNT